MPSSVLRENKKGRMRKMEKQRIYFVIDMKSFFASVECLDLPHLKNVPMAVAGNTEDRHGIILAKNEAAMMLTIRAAAQAASTMQALRCVGLSSAKRRELS